MAKLKLWQLWEYSPGSSRLRKIDDGIVIGDDEKDAWEQVRRKDYRGVAAITIHQEDDDA